MKLLPINGKYSNNSLAIVDDDDFERCSLRQWHMTPLGRPKTNYKMENGKWKIIFLHQFILNFPNYQIDHINRDPLDNRKGNLRPCTRSQNNINSPPRSGRRYKGIRLNGKKWEARIRINKKDIYLGIFEKEVEAALAYNNAAKKYFGEYAWLNQF